MAQILSGTIVRDALVATLAEQVSKLPSAPQLVILQVGNRPDSNAYIQQKKRFGEKIGITVVHKQYDETVSEQELGDAIKKYNADKEVHGILLQIPLPAHFDKDGLIEMIDPRKDVDGLTAYNTKLLFDGHPGGYTPATPRGIISLLKYYGVAIEGKNVVIVGRSSLVGKPVALAFLNENATVTIAHLHTKDLASVTRQADILVVAIGDPLFITEQYVKPGQIVIDVGINASDKGLVGDVDFKTVEPIVEAITPVPKGVGPMTVVSLFQNVLDAYEKIADNTNS
jgi:methylenetetrahydrofolate dehydrogenase (NADP+) / methenyltetrahydrofolate cyclohydrolase